jgi:hypothetical protein
MWIISVVEFQKKRSLPDGSSEKLARPWAMGIQGILSLCDHCHLSSTQALYCTEVEVAAASAAGVERAKL